MFCKQWKCVTKFNHVSNFLPCIRRVSRSDVFETTLVNKSSALEFVVNLKLFDVVHPLRGYADYFTSSPNAKYTFTGREWCVYVPYYSKIFIHLSKSDSDLMHDSWLQIFVIRMIRARIKFMTLAWRKSCAKLNCLEETKIFIREDENIIFAQM